MQVHAYGVRLLYIDRPVYVNAFRLTTLFVSPAMHSPPFQISSNVCACCGQLDLWTSSWRQRRTVPLFNQIPMRRVRVHILVRELLNGSRSSDFPSIDVDQKVSVPLTNVENSHVVPCRWPSVYCKLQKSKKIVCKSMLPCLATTLALLAVWGIVVLATVFYAWPLAPPDGQVRLGNCTYLF